MKTTKKILSLILVIGIMLTTLSCGFITASAQATEKLNVTKMDGKTLPIKEMKGLPEDISSIEFFNNEDDDDPWSQSRLNWVVATGDTWNESTYEERCFIAYSIDGVNYTTVYVDELPVFERFESYEEFEVSWFRLAEYGNGAFYFDITVHVSDPSTDYYDYLTVYIKTDDFIDWEEVSEIPSFEKDVAVTLPEGAYYIEGEYNGVYVARGDVEWGLEEDDPIRINYFISYDGENWEKKTTPEIAFPEDECASMPYYERFGEMMVTSSGVIFWAREWSVAFCSRTQLEFKNYYITTDFENYQKIDLSALGECKGEIDIDGMTITYDDMDIMDTLYDNKPVFRRWTGTEGLYEDEGYDGEIEYYPDEVYTSSDWEIYTLNEDTMSLERFATMENCDNFRNWSFSTNHMWFMCQTLEGDWYINIYEGEESRRYAWDGTESFNAVSWTGTWDETDNFLNEENIANVKGLRGIKNNDTFFFTIDSFETVYEFSLKHLGEEVYYENFTHQGDMIIYTEDENYTPKYYLIDKSQIEEMQEDVYNLGEETYSFSNFGDSDSPYGHCFGMSMTSAAYYNKIMNIEGVGGNDKDNVYGLELNSSVKAPICYYQNRQGYSIVKNSTVAGGKFYKENVWDINWEWEDIVNYVKNHEYDDTALLQVCYYKNYGDEISGHAVNFLCYQVVDGEERLYVYDNNFPDKETYFYKGSDGKVYQAPYATFPGGIDAIQLVYVPTYFQYVGTYDFTRYIYSEQGNIKVEGAIEYYEFSDSENSRVIFEVPADKDVVKIIPLKNNASFEYVDKKYTFGNVNDNTVGELVLSTENGDVVTDPSFVVKGEGNEQNYTFSIQSPSRTEIRNKDGIILHANVDGTAPNGSYVRWESSNGNFDKSTDGSNLKIIAKNKGWTTFTAILCDADGNELARDTVDMYSKSGFFDKIGGFFRSLFGTTKVYDA